MQGKDINRRFVGYLKVSLQHEDGQMHVQDVQH